MDVQAFIKLIENEVGFKRFEVMKIFKSLGDDDKVHILRYSAFIEKYDIKGYEIQQIIKSLSDEKKREILIDRDFIKNKLHLEGYQVPHIVASIESEAIKSEIIALYEFEDYQKLEILKTFSDKSKTRIILENEYGIGKIYLQILISTLSVDALVEFFRDNREWLSKMRIKPYEITTDLNKEKQLDFVSKFEDAGLSLEERRQILVTLKQETKSDIDTSNFPPEYITAINIKVADGISKLDPYMKVIIEFDKDLEIYKGLDALIYMNPINFSKQEKERLLQLFEICPKIGMIDLLGISQSTVEEYISGENWIESVLQGINPEWSDIQKVAFIDHKIGKKISYAPDYDTEVCNEQDVRSLWKIIHSEYGVCNGISQIERYILSKVGIRTEMVSGIRHSFLKLKNIEMPDANGNMVTGDTILDPTWNLAAHRYGAKPANFCRSYAEIRKNDIKGGKDTQCHKNDAALSSATLDLDEQNLRQVFKSIGLADKDGNFPVKALLDESKRIDNLELPEEEAIKRQLSLLSEYCPEFAKCQYSTLNILSGNILNQKNLKFNKCVASRVYKKSDKSKRPVIYVYIDFPQSGKKFYIADADLGQFVELPQKEFESRFECYDKDMKKYRGHRPWEDQKITEHTEDVTKSSEERSTSERKER